MTDLGTQALACRQLLDAVRAAGIDDEEVLESVVSGETDLVEAISGALAEIDRNAALAAGCKRREEELAGRRARLDKTSANIKAAIAKALDLARVPLPLRLPEATVTLSRGRQKVMVTDASALPANLLRSKVTTSPDLTLIGERLHAGHYVPGATLTNAEPSLAIRRS